MCLAASEYDCVNVVFHGGEPLLAPQSFFEAIVALSKAMPAVFSFSLQTNGLLLDRRMFLFLENLGIHCGVSLDGLANDSMRGHTQDILENVSEIQHGGGRIGALCVVGDLSQFPLIDTYHWFNSKGISTKFNPLFLAGAAMEGDLPGVDYQCYLEQFVDLFRYWAADGGCAISVDNFYEVIDTILFNRATNCLYSSCLGRWLCMGADGDLYPCDRLAGQESFYLGSITSFDSIRSMFETEKFTELLKGAIARKRFCKATCEIFDFCNAGCNSEALLNGNVALPNADACEFRRKVITSLTSDIFRLNESYLRDPSSIPNTLLRGFLTRRYGES